MANQNAVTISHTTGTRRGCAGVWDAWCGHSHGGDERPKKDKTAEKEKREKDKRENGDRRSKTKHGRAEEAMGVEVKRVVAVVVKEEEADQELGSSVVNIKAAPHTWFHKVVPSSTPSTALEVPWLHAALQKEPSTLDTPLSRGPLDARSPCISCCSARCRVPSSTPTPLAPRFYLESEEGAGWRWRVGGRAAAPHPMLGSSEVSKRKCIKAFRVLGSVVNEVLYHRSQNGFPLQNALQFAA